MRYLEGGEHAEQLAYRLQLEQVHQLLVTRSAREGNLLALTAHQPSLLDALDAGGGPEAIAHARELTFIGTRRYVRRQRSWFRRDHRIGWLDGAAPGVADEVVPNAAANDKFTVVRVTAGGTVDAIAKGNLTKKA